MGIKAVGHAGDIPILKNFTYEKVHRNFVKKVLKITEPLCRDNHCVSKITEWWPSFSLGGMKLNPWRAWLKATHLSKSVLNIWEFSQDRSLLW